MATLAPGLGQMTVGTWQFAHADLLGSLRSLTNAQGQVLAIQQYSPFGSVEAPTGAAGPWGFTGAPQDAASGLTYLRARYYHPTLGRFLTPDALVPDSINGQAWNGYAYVYNDVANLVDPNGFDPEPPSGFPNQPGDWDGVVDGYHPQMSEPQRSLEFYRHALARTGEAVNTGWQQTQSGAAQWWNAKPTCGCGTPTPAPGGDAVLKTGSIAETAILGHSIWPSINVDIQVTKAQRFAVFGVGLTHWEPVGRVLQRPAHEMRSYLGSKPWPWRNIPLRTPRTGWQTRLNVRPVVSGFKGAMTMLGVGVGMDMLFQFIDDHGLNRRCLSNRDTLARLLVAGGMSVGVGATSLSVASIAAAAGKGPFITAISGIGTTIFLNEVALPSTKDALLDAVTSK